MRSRVWWVASAVAVATGVLAPMARSMTDAQGDAVPPEPAAAAPTAVDVAASLPSVGSGERPGPEVLYAEAPAAPQLENRHAAFAAPFDRVSGTDRYVDGEYLYTDHLYDDGGDALAYPDDAERYGGNAADLVELRISTRLPDATHYRFTLNTLLAHDSTIALVAFDTDGDEDTGTDALPGDPGTAVPGTDAVLSTWGTGATWSTWDGDGWDVAPLASTTDLEANQITVAVPDTVARLAGEVDATVAVGLHDTATNGFLRPDPAKSGIYNVGFRFDEAILESSAAPDEDQSAALAAGDISRYRHTLDFDAIRAGAEHTTVPRTGTMVRFFPSRLSLGEGRDGGFPAHLGQLQPYSIYVPRSYDGRAVGLTLDLHSLGQRHWQYNGSTGVQQLGEERGSIVATADARGEDGWYQHEAEYDVFEMWNDIARHYALDPNQTAITGYSMGGYATYRLGTLYPDLFGSAVSVVGPPGDGIWLGVGAPTGGAETLTNLWLENARNVPYMNIVAAEDELVPISGTSQQNVGPAYSGRTSFDALGYRYAFDVYPTAEHLTLAALGYDLPQAAAFMGDARVDRDPFHVTLAYVPAADAPELGLVHDHAYWVSDVRLADETVGPMVSSLDDAPIGKGVIDVESLARGVDDPAATKAQSGGTVPLPYVETSQTWGEPVARAASNTLVLKLTNIGSATIDLARAGIDPAQGLEVQWESDAEGVLTLVGGAEPIQVPVSPGSGSMTRLTAAEPEAPPVDDTPADQPSPTVSQPTVIGPIGDEGIRTKEPFFTTLLPLPEGWIEEEFFYEGVAQTPEEMAAGTPGTTPYRSRIMVRRPTDPAAFNGTVIVDWNNVTVPQDRDVAWHPLYHTLLARGYAYVSVAAQRLSIEASPLALKQYDPVRYGSLSHPGDDYSFDIFSQAAEAVLTEQVMGELRPHVTTRLAMGASQSGGRLKTYINEVHEHARVFDGFQPQISGPSGVRRDLAPIVWVNSGGEADDEDTTPPDSELFRLWEIAGTAHTSHGSSQLMNDNLVWNHSNGQSGPKEEAHDIEDSFAWGYQLDPGECARENYSVAGLTWSAALVALDTWVKTGEAPAPMPRLTRDENGRVYDEHGNMAGGVRAPYLDVPLGTYYGGDVPDGSLDPCANVGGRMALSGYTRMFSAAKLDTLYESAEDYVARLDAAIDDALAKGFILPEGAAEMRERAARAAAILDRPDAAPPVPGGA